MFYFACCDATFKKQVTLSVSCAGLFGNKKQAGAELGQAQVKLEVIVKVGVEDRCIYLILRGF